jgi:hypothetical protein
MSQSILNAIARAREKRNRKWDAWWSCRTKDPVKRAEIEQNRINFVTAFAAGIPHESIPLTSPEQSDTVTP